MLITLLSQEWMWIYSAKLNETTVKNLKRDGVVTTPAKLITPRCLQAHGHSLDPNWKILSSRPWAKWTIDVIIFIRRRHGRTDLSCRRVRLTFECQGTSPRNSWAKWTIEFIIFIRRRHGRTVLSCRRVKLTFECQGTSPRNCTKPWRKFLQDLT